MFESELLQTLKSNAELTSYVSTYAGRPAIFHNFAPEKVEYPYITFKINRLAAEDEIIERFNIYVEYWDRRVVKNKANAASRCIEFLLDRAVLDNEHLSNIRIFYDSTDLVDESDVSMIHYSHQFKARACRESYIRRR